MWKSRQADNDLKKIIPNKKNFFQTLKQNRSTIYADTIIPCSIALNLLKNQVNKTTLCGNFTWNLTSESLNSSFSNDINICLAAFKLIPHVIHFERCDVEDSIKMASYRYKMINMCMARTDGLFQSLR